MLILKPYHVIHYLRSKKKTLGYLLIAACTIVTIKWLFFPNKQPTLRDARMVEVATAQRQDIRQTIQFIGTIRAQQATMLVTKAKGVLDILIPPGSPVKKGALIAKIRSKDIDQNTQLSSDSVAIAKAQYERALQLLKKGVLSKNAVEEKKTLWIDAQKKLSDAHLQLDQINIEAPFDGIIGLFKIKDGSQVQEGEALAALYDPSSLRVEFDIPMSVVRALKDQTPVIVKNKLYALTYVQRMLDEETHMCPAYVAIQCNDCIIGETTDIAITSAEKKAVIVIPYEAIFLRDGKPYVYRIEKHYAQLTPVTLGIRAKESVEILSGVGTHDQIIVRGQARLYPGAPVITEAELKRKE